MKIFYKFIYVLFFLILLVPVLIRPKLFADAVDGQIVDYVIVNEEGDVISQKSDIEVGDTFITGDFYEYEIYKVEGDIGYAHIVRKIEMPKINRTELPQKRGVSFKKLCLYMTHNDESYMPSDGYDSIYGAGGIHDVAGILTNELQDRGIDVVLDETLHIPHNSSAYSRSGVTAQRLFNEEWPDALFDIHRDGVSKSYYYTNQNGQDLSKIRIVVGKSNPNFEENYAFAQKVFAIGKAMYPWLFLDIYCGKGHYNQQLMPTNLLFEMGTYLIEKEYVYNSVPYLVDVIETAMYNSVDNGKDEIIVGDDAPATNESVNNEQADVGTSKVEGSSEANNHWIGWLLGAVVVVIIGGFVYFYVKKSR